MIRKTSVVLETGLFVLAVLALYILALSVFPLFREPYGLLVQVFEEGDLSFPPPTWVFLSSFLFALAGALMAHWTPALSLRTLACFWSATYLLYWVDSALGLARSTDGWMTGAAGLLGLAALAIFFWVLSLREPETPLHFQPPTWRSRLAGGWLIVWMGFFAGTSSVLLSEVPLYPMRRLFLSLAALAMALWSYHLSSRLRKAQGEEEDGVASTWRWLLVAWVLLALLHYFFRVRGGA